MNNLKQIGLALMIYETSNTVFPVSYLGNPTLTGTAYGITYPDDGNNGWPGFAWGTMILPYIEQSPLSAATKVNLPCWSPDNITSGTTKLMAFLCPSVSTSTDAFSVPRSTQGDAGNPLNGVPYTPLIFFSQSHYVLNAGQTGPWNRAPAYTYDLTIPAPVPVGGTTILDVTNGPFFRNSRTRTADVTDGLSTTVFAGENRSILTYKTRFGVVPFGCVVPQVPPIGIGDGRCRR